jgi:hypothetical protein
MRIVIERSGRSFVTHALHLAMLGVMVYNAFTREDPLGYSLCALWVMISYVRYNMLVTANVELDAAKEHIMDEVRKDLKKFLKENKEHLINKLNQDEE